MPQHTGVDDDHVKKLIQGGGLKQTTLDKRRKVAEDFSNYVYNSMSADVQDLLDGDKAVLEGCLTKYFDTMRVTQAQPDGTKVQVVPKLNCTITILYYLENQTAQNLIFQKVNG